MHDRVYSSPTPLIGITGRQALGSLIGAPQGFADAPIDIYLREYAQAVTAAGGVAVHIPLEAGPTAIIDRLDALIIAGGEDVDPSFYGQEPDARTSTVDPVRDRIEMALLAAAAERRIPVLGICRGQQLINVAYGGSVIQDLETPGCEAHMTGRIPRAERAHAVVFDHGSTAYELYGPSTTVNSFHHQAVDRLGDGVQATGWAPDGTIESIEVLGSPITAVQWHPECFDRDPIFDWLIAKARACSPATCADSDDTANRCRAVAHAE